MPEGDTLHTIALRMAPLLVGRPLTEVRLRGLPVPDLAGRTVTSVQAVGKHLLVHLDGDRALRTHLGLHGSWHRYAPGERWTRPPTRAHLELATADEVLVCFDATEVEVLDGRRLRFHPVLERLGPDLLAPEVDLEQVVERALADPGRDRGDVLLDQRVAAGIGNVYKSELPFLERVHPAGPIGALDRETVARLYVAARRWLQRNVGGGPRITTAEPGGPLPNGARLWVYGRDGRPCLVCEEPVRRARTGATARSTFWCPRCQPAVHDL